jgi:prevent-host-death family protein
MKTVSAKELKNRTGEILRRVRAGETVVVTMRGIRVAKVVPEKAVAARSRSDRRSRHAAIRSIAGKYKGLGTVQDFLDEKAREIMLER